MTTVRGVRAEPGGKVTLEFTPDGWTVTRAGGSGLEPSQWLGIGIVVCLVLALGAGQLAADWPVVGLLGLAGLFLVGIVLLMLAEFVAAVFGMAWLAGSALTRGGRRAIRREAGKVVDAVTPDFIPAARVTGVRVSDAAVEVTLDDGIIHRYTGSGAELAAAFRQLLQGYSA